MSVNARGVFLCLKHQIPLMLETAERQGAIVITSSTAGGWPIIAIIAATAAFFLQLLLSAPLHHTAPAVQPEHHKVLCDQSRTIQHSLLQLHFLWRVLLRVALGVSAVPFTCAYSAAKHAVVGMMRCAAAEYTPQGLRINCINPGPTGGLANSAMTGTAMLCRACQLTGCRGAENPTFIRCTQQAPPTWEYRQQWTRWRMNHVHQHEQFIGCPVCCCAVACAVMQTPPWLSASQPSSSPTRLTSQKAC
jgi:NAD(P)-dependent dehydrogenase (short-subunit alcohol dehydrogenase family)